MMIDRQRRDEVTILRMDREPANVLDLEFSDAITDALREAAADPTTNAIVLTGTGKVFSAGVDLFRVLEDGPGYLPGFFASLNLLFQTAKALPKPIVAAINGHAIAGGAVLAFACDFRVMAEGPGKIALPELDVGVPFPGSALRIIRGAVPARSRRDLVLRRKSFGPDVALDGGLVDELAAPEHVLERAVALATEMGSVPAQAFAVTRALLAADSLDEAALLEVEVQRIWAAADTRQRMRQYLERTLGKRERR